MWPYITGLRVFLKTPKEFSGQESTFSGIYFFLLNLGRFVQSRHLLLDLHILLNFSNGNELKLKLILMNFNYVFQLFFSTEMFPWGLRVLSALAEKFERWLAQMQG